MTQFGAQRPGGVALGRVAPVFALPCVSVGVGEGVPGLGAVAYGVRRRGAARQA